MSKASCVLVCSSLFLASLISGGSASFAQAPAPKTEVKAEEKFEIKPEVMSLLKQSTESYRKMKSYRHTAVWSLTAKRDIGQPIQEELKFTLALDRPNKFAYKMDTSPVLFSPAAAVSDGSFFINFKGDRKQYTKTAAPATFKGINIVDDVEFQPIGTYLIALMLQGDALADKDILKAMGHATLGGTVSEGGKKWQVISMPFGSEETPYQVYFNAEDHLIGKVLQMGSVRIIENIESVKIDKPIEASVFAYALPETAKQVEKFVVLLRPNDA